MDTHEQQTGSLLKTPRNLGGRTLSTTRALRWVATSLGQAIAEAVFAQESTANCMCWYHVSHTRRYTGMLMWMLQVEHGGGDPSVLDANYPPN